MNSVIPYGYVYRITNKDNGFTYIGKHRYYPKEHWRAYMGSGVYISNSVKKHGQDKFVKSLVSYHWSKESLSASEEDEILKELENGGAQYNIDYGKNKSSKRFTFIEKLNSPKDLLDMYFDKNMSYPEIALELNTSATSVFNYMKEHFGNDDRFEKISQGNRRGKSNVTKRSRVSSSEVASRRELCNFCERHINKINMTKHIIRHYTPELPRSEKSRDRTNYIPLELRRKIQRGEKRSKEIGKYASHKRWHLNRGVISPNCELCKESTE